MQRLLLVFWKMTVPEGGGGGVAFTVSVAAVVVAGPAEFREHRAIAVPVLRQSRREAQGGGSGSGDVVKRHAIRADLPLHRGVGEPVAAAVKLAVWPTATV